LDLGGVVHLPVDEGAMIEEIAPPAAVPVVPDNLELLPPPRRLTE